MLSGNNDTDDKDFVPVLGRRYSHSLSIHEKDVGAEWNDNHEELARTWSQRSKDYSLLHDQAGKYYKTLDKMIGLPAKLIFLFVSSAQFGQLSDTQSSTAITYIVLILGIIGFLVDMGQDWLDFGGISTKHFLASSVYDKLNMDILVELANPKNKRTNVRAFLRNARGILSDTKSTAPDIPDYVLEKYVNNTTTQPPNLPFVSVTTPPPLVSATPPPSVPPTTPTSVPPTTPHSVPPITPPPFVSATTPTSFIASAPSIPTDKQSPSPYQIPQNNNNNHNHNHQLQLMEPSRPSRLSLDIPGSQEDEPISDIQDEFAKELAARRQAKIQKSHKYQEDRMAEFNKTN